MDEKLHGETWALVLGTQNPGKKVELVRLLGPIGFRLITLEEAGSTLDVVEDADSFAVNAAKKATEQAKHLGAWVLGEDSGICVDALDGAPGVISARFAGEDASPDRSIDECNNEKLLAQLEGVPPSRRTAHYVCHMALSDPTGDIRATCERTCRGRILAEPCGKGGFGYDPLFEIVEYHRTFGELSAELKNVLSHRGRAMRAMVPQLWRIANSGAWAQCPAPQRSKS